jgi:hypothetical protein
LSPIPLWVVAELYARINVGWRRAFGVVQKGKDGYKDGFDALGRRPTLCRKFARLFVFTGGVENRDTEVAVGVNVWVPN